MAWFLAPISAYSDMATLNEHFYMMVAQKGKKGHFASVWPSENGIKDFKIKHFILDAEEHIYELPAARVSRKIPKFDFLRFPTVFPEVGSHWPVTNIVTISAREKRISNVLDKEICSQN